MSEKTIYFGEHITLDGYGGDFRKLNDKSVVLDILDNLPSLLEMKKLSDPVVYHAEGNDKKDPGGWTGFVVIGESHISVHTFPARGFVSADVYTCRNGMDREFICNFFKEKFLLGDLEVNFLKRGTRYPAQDRE